MSIKSIIRNISVAVMLAATATVANADDYIKHVAQRGETLYGIAHKYKVPYKVIEQLNPQASNGVKKGMEILVPKDASKVSENQPKEQTAVAEKQEAAAAKAIEPVSEATQIVEQSQTSIPDVYYAQKGDTFDAISNKYGLSIDQMIDLNPFLDPNSLKPGTMVRLSDNAPMTQSKKQTPVEEPVKEIEPEPDPLELPIAINLETESAGNEIEPEEIIIGEEEIEGEVEKTVLILLPFMAENEAPDKQAQRYGDFYRGFLMAMQEAEANSNVKIDILALDTNNDADRLKMQLENSLPRDVEIIIAPEDEAALKVISQFGEDNGIYVLNLFNIKDEGYQETTKLLQANISQQLMYEKAIDFFVNEYNGAIPVFLSSNTGRNEKKPFVDALKARYAADGKDILEVNYDETLKPTDLEFILPDLKYVFVPSSGALSEFNKFARAINEIRAKDDDGLRFMVFGYPDWTAFRTDARDMLHNLEATIYSRFYYDDSSAEAKRLNESYYDWYGTMINEGVPVQSILGYDAGTLLLKAMRSKYSLEQIFQSGTTFKGVQSTFQFAPYQQSKGLINNALYIIKFLPQRYTDVRVI